MAVLAYRVGGVERDLDRLGTRVRDQDRKYDELHDAVAVHSEQISGDGGLQNGLRLTRAEIRSMRTAFYALTASLIVVAFALTGAIISHAL